MLDEVGEGIVQIAGLLLKDAESDFDPCVTEFGKTPTADLRIRVLGGDDAAADSGGDEGVGAGAGAAVMAAGFEGDVGRGSFDGEAALCGLFEGDDLRVVAVGVEVRAFAYDLRGASAGWRLGKDAAYLRVGRG